MMCMNKTDEANLVLLYGKNILNKKKFENYHT